eukprot:668344-Hanusia_phi.AAC.2
MPRKTGYCSMTPAIFKPTVYTVRVSPNSKLRLYLVSSQALVEPSFEEEFADFRSRAFGHFQIRICAIAEDDAPSQNRTCFYVRALLDVCSCLKGYAGTSEFERVESFALGRKE